MPKKKALLLSLFLFCFYAQTLQAQFDEVGSGRAIYFDGIDDYIDLSSIYDDLTLPFTISAWVYGDPTATAPGPIFTSQDNSDVYNGFWFFATPYSMIFEYGDGTGSNNPVFRKGKISLPPDLPGRWNHVCGVMKSATDIELYVNGVNVGGY